MIKSGEIETLSSLARLSLTEVEKEKLKTDLESILGYVSELGNIEALASERQDLGLVKNVFRSDDSSHESGSFSDKLLEQAPLVSNNFVEVKKILDNNN